jgi:hypothetical protein
MPLDEADIQRIVAAEIEAAIGFTDDNFQSKREKAISYYHGEDFGSGAQEGRSQVVITEVADAVETATPSLMRVFSGADVVTIQARNPQSVAYAAQATDVCRYTFERELGFAGLTGLVKDALLYGMAAVKCVYQDEERVEEELHEGLSELQLTALLEDDMVEVLEQTVQVSAEVEIGEQDLPVDPATGMPAEPPMSFDVRVNRRIIDSGVVLSHIPPNEILVADDAVTVKSSRLIGHRSNRTLSELVGLGYDLEELKEHSASEIQEGQEERDRYQDVRESSASNAADESMAEVEYCEVYVRLDADEDGIAELHRVCTLGSGHHVLMDEVITHCPIVIGTVIHMGHRLIGRGIAELLFDCQEIKSSIVRQHLDNLYAQNNSRTIAVEGQVQMDDLLSATPGGIVRVRQPGAVQPLQVAPLQASAFQLLEYVDTMAENRTGLQNSAGLSLDKLQSVSAIGINGAMSQAQSKTEMMARTFAETLIKPVYQAIYHLLRTHQDRPKIMRLRGSNFVEIEPSAWDENVDTMVSVGLGTAGNHEQRLMFLRDVAEKQTAMLTQLGLDNPIATLPQHAEVLRRMLQIAGIEDTELIVNSPEKVSQLQQQMAQKKAQEQPKPNPQMQQALQIEQAKAQAEIEIEKQKAQATMQLKAQAQAQELQLKREKAMADIEIRREEMAAEAQMEALKIQYDLPGGDANIPRQ